MTQREVDDYVLRFVAAHPGCHQHQISKSLAGRLVDSEHGRAVYVHRSIYKLRKSGLIDSPERCPTCNRILNTHPIELKITDKAANRLKEIK